MKDLIDLQSVHVTQLTTKEGKGNWLIRKNITCEDLYELPGNWSEEDVFSILKFARKFELIAFNVGVQYGKDVNEGRLKLAIDENLRLALVVDELTKKEIKL